MVLWQQSLQTLRVFGMVAQGSGYLIELSRTGCKLAETIGL